MTTFAAVRRRSRSVLLGLLVLVGALGLGTAAQAHDMLVASDPAEGAVLEAPPEAVTLSFNNPPLEVGSVITVVDAQGTTLAEGTGTLEGTDVVLPLDTPLPAGELEVRWRVASSDGHPIEGVIPFTVAEQAAPATTAPAEPAAPVSEPAAEESEPAATSEPADEGSGLAGLPTWSKVAIAVAAVGALAALVVVMLRRQRGDRL
ncbi:copper resistance CopC family protein [Georgenia phoenicis]|uniref:copper resistance CopC family protein n=1 Tax=unclassified Georgenia TaxID=2626815 RepID=UPI0039B081ED